MEKHAEAIGRRFGRWTILADSPRKGYLVCRCDCGETRAVQTNSVLLGRSRSCGCYMREQTSKATRTHGESGTRLYKAWNSMISRCETPSQTSFKHYGGRGISVCEEWHSFGVFKEWAISNGYETGLTLDRIDNNGNYCPTNCRWVTKKEQANNRRSSRYVTLSGTTHTLSEWADITGINPSTIAWRIRHGWSDEEILNTPVRAW